MSKWCCDWFDRLLQQTGEKGFSISASVAPGRRLFYLHARPFEADVIRLYDMVDEVTIHNKWPKLVDSNGIPVPYVTDLRIPLSYCPRCGADLDETIRMRIEEYDQLPKEVEDSGV